MERMKTFLLILNFLGLGLCRENVTVTKFHVKTEIQMRYAITDIVSDLVNVGPEDLDEVTFDMYLPNEAFVSNFTLTVNGTTYQALVKEKKEAKETYEKSEDNAGLVETKKSDDKDKQYINFMVKLESGAKATIHLRYEELLERNAQGKYKYELNLRPQDQDIADFEVSIKINETLPIKDVKVTKIDYKTQDSKTKEDITKAVVFHDSKMYPNYADVILSGNDFSENTEDWIFRLKYEVIKPKDGHEIQIGAGRFVHYFSPENLPNLAKHVVFVIDISGSMSGRKMSQVKDAMVLIIETMAEAKIDFVNILLFNSDLSDDAGIRTNLKPFFSMNDLNENVGPIIDFILDLRPHGGTDINSALLEALDLSKNITKKELLSKDVQQMIIFLTDGAPTSGVTDKDQIVQNVAEANADSNIPIYSIAFGEDADYDLLQRISDENFGYAQRVYESGNSYEQLENFYFKLSDPKLSKVSFQYMANGQRIPKSDLTRIYFKNIFGSEDYVIVGTLPDQSIEKFKVISNSYGIDQEHVNEKIDLIACREDPSEPNAQHLQLPIDADKETLSEFLTINRCIPTGALFEPRWLKSPAEQFMERLWAFKRINYLIKKSKKLSTKYEVIEYEYEESSSEEPQVEIELDIDLTTKALDSIGKKKEKLKEEAIALAIKYNFVTDLTSMVVEDTDDYIKSSFIGPMPVWLERVEPFKRNKGPFYTMRAAATPMFSANSAGSSPIFYSNNSNGPRTSVFKTLGKNRVRAKGRPQYTTPWPIFSTTTTMPPRNYNDFALSTKHSNFMDIEYDDSSSDGIPVGECKLILFSKTNMRGTSLEVLSDVQDLSLEGFKNKVGSMEIEGQCCWEIFTMSNFAGRPFMARFRDNFASAESIKQIYKKAVSVRKMNC